MLFWLQLVQFQRFLPVVPPWFYYGVDGVSGFEYEGEQYFYRKNIFGDILGVYKNAELIVKYAYDAWGENKTYVSDGSNWVLLENSTASDSNSDYARNVRIAKLNPFLYRGYCFDRETNLYYLNARYYDPQVGRFLCPDDISYLDPTTLGGLNLYAYCNNDPVNYADPTGHAPWWSWALSGLQLVGGITLCFVPGLQGLGASLAIGGATGLIMNSLEPQLAQIIGGAGSMANGYGAISTGASLMSLGGWAAVAGFGLIVIGAGTMAFGANEVADVITGTNYIQKWTGMSDLEYAWSYLGLNFASSVGTGLGQRYVQLRTRTAIYNPDGSVKQYRYYKNKSKLYDVDFNHAGNMKFPHYHGWLRNGTRLGKNHPGYLIMILQLFGRIFR